MVHFPTSGQENYARASCKAWFFPGLGTEMPQVWIGGGRTCVLNLKQGERGPCTSRGGTSSECRPHGQGCWFLRLFPSKALHSAQTDRHAPRLASPRVASDVHVVLTRFTVSSGPEPTLLAPTAGTGRLILGEGPVGRRGSAAGRGRCSRA